MEIVNRVSRMSSIAAKVSAGDMKVGLLSTMGTIHPGHLDLIRAARQMSDLVVVSVFVNRLQFLSDDEYGTYPRDFTRDVDLLSGENVDYVFAPPEEEMYPADFSTFVEVEDFGIHLPGLPRRAFFRGMTTSVLKLINIIRPSFIFFGQKDGLQGCILRKMVRDLNIGTEVVVTPVERYESGLAYGARNYFLSDAEKGAAAVIHRSLEAAVQLVSSGEDRSRRIIKEITAIVASEPLAALEYAIVADTNTLEPLNRIEGTALVAVGARIGSTSLHDSVQVELAAD